MLDNWHCTCHSTCTYTCRRMWQFRYQTHYARRYYLYARSRSVRWTSTMKKRTVATAGWGSQRIADQSRSMRGFARPALLSLMFVCWNGPNAELCPASACPTRTCWKLTSTKRRAPTCASGIAYWAAPRNDSDRLPGWWARSLGNPQEIKWNFPKENHPFVRIFLVFQNATRTDAASLRDQVRAPQWFWTTTARPCSLAKVSK